MELKWHLLYKSRSGIHMSFGGILSETGWSFIGKYDMIQFIIFFLTQYPFISYPQNCLISRKN